MEPLHYKCIQALSKCTFIPGSFEKRFVRDMETLGEYDMLSKKQTAFLERLAWRYRQQIGKKLVPSLPVEPSSRDLIKLAQWKKGEPI